MDKKEVGYLFNAEYALGQDKRITVSGNFPLNATVEDMTTEMDKVFSALDKQRIKRLELPTARQALADQKDKLEELKKEVGKLSLKKQAGQLRTDEKSHLEGHTTTIARLEEIIPKGEEFVAELEKKAA